MLIFITNCSGLLPKLPTLLGTPTLSGAINADSASLFIKDLDIALSKAKFFNK